MVGAGLCSARRVVADIAICQILYLVAVFCCDLWFGLVRYRAAIDGNYCRHLRQAKRRQSLWLDFYVAPDRRGDYGFDGWRNSERDGRLSICFLIRRCDRDDRRGAGVANQAETEGSDSTCDWGPSRRSVSTRIRAKG